MKTQKFYRRARLSAGVAPVVLGLAMIAAPAQAQDAQAAADDTSADEIVVTGTLIQNPNLSSSSPVSFVGSNEIELKQSTNAEQILREVPGVVAGLGSNTNNGTNGTSTIDLRGLGTKRNIVLLDGVRLVPSATTGEVDLNNIPLALIQRVDVLTGGASTTYGADAVAGVVNFITRKDFAGLDARVTEGISERGDTNKFAADITIGANFDDGRGNAVLSVGYQEADALYFGKRPAGVFTINSLSGIAAGESDTAVPTTIAFSDGTTQQVNASGTALVPQYAKFNFNPYNVFSTPYKRYNIFAKADYDVSDSITVYTRGSFNKTTVAGIIAPSGVFGETLTIPANNPYLPAAIRDQICAAELGGASVGTAACNANPALPLPAVYRRTVELGPRVSTYTTQFFDYTAGFRANITDKIKADVYGSYGETSRTEVRSGYVARSRIQLALNADNPNTCNLNPLPLPAGCVPLNLFGPAGSITAAQGAYLGGITSSIRNEYSLAQVHGVVSGELVSTPWASDAIAFAVGAEYRKYTGDRDPDNLALVPGELGGAGGAVLPIHGGYDVKEAFGELIVPLVSDKPFFDKLELEAGIRYSKYRVDAPGNPRFNATTYKFGATWAPDPAVTFRGNYQHAVRAPNIFELFGPVATGLTNLATDPCAGSSNPAAANYNPGLVAGQNLRQACINQRAPAAVIDGVGIQNPNSGQANATGGGDPNRTPETANTYTLGVVLAPSKVVPGLTVSVDYYNIKITSAITAATPDDIIAACFGTNPIAITAAQAASAACTSILRSTVNGRLSGSPATVPGLPAPLTNLGTLKTDGVDLRIDYKRDIGFADLNLNFTGNYTRNAKFKASPTTPKFRECTGYYSANCGFTLGELQPKYSFTQRTTLGFSSFDVSLLWRHIDSMKYEPGLPALFSGTITGSGAGATAPLVGKSVNFNRIKAYNWFDLSTRFHIGDHIDLTLSAFNIFDKKPPIVGAQAGTTSANSGNTFPSVYDVVGRSYSATARFKF